MQGPTSGWWDLNSGPVWVMEEEGPNWGPPSGWQDPGRDPKWVMEMEEPNWGPPSGWWDGGRIGAGVSAGSGVAERQTRRGLDGAEAGPRHQHEGQGPPREGLLGKVSPTPPQGSRRPAPGGANSHLWEKHRQEGVSPALPGGETEARGGDGSHLGALVEVGASRHPQIVTSTSPPPCSAGHPHQDHQAGGRTHRDPVGHGHVVPALARAIPQPLAAGEVGPRCGGGTRSPACPLVTPRVPCHLPPRRSGVTSSSASRPSTAG